MFLWMRRKKWKAVSLPDLHLPLSVQNQAGGGGTAQRMGPILVAPKGTRSAPSTFRVFPGICSQVQLEATGQALNADRVPGITQLSTDSVDREIGLEEMRAHSPASQSRPTKESIWTRAISQLILFSFLPSTFSLTHRFLFFFSASFSCLSLNLNPHVQIFFLH